MSLATIFLYLKEKNYFPSCSGAQWRRSLLVIQSSSVHQLLVPTNSPQPPPPSSSLHLPWSAPIPRNLVTNFHRPVASQHSWFSPSFLENLSICFKRYRPRSEILSFTEFSLFNLFWAWFYSTFFCISWFWISSRCNKKLFLSFIQF